MSNGKSPLRRRITPSVPFILHVEDEGGNFEQSFQLAYDLNSMALFEEATGMNLFKDIGQILSTRSVTIVTALFWAGVQINHGADYNGQEGLEILRSNITLPQFGPIMEACLKAFVTQLTREQQNALKAKQEGTAPVAAPLAQGEVPTATA